jgi:hypothetical protein
VTITGRYIWGLAVLTFLWGLVVYASPSPSDHLYGALIMAWGGAMAALLFFPDRPMVRILRGVTVAPMLLTLAYCALK